MAGLMDEVADREGALRKAQREADRLAIKLVPAVSATAAEAVQKRGQAEEGAGRRQSSKTHQSSVGFAGGDRRQSSHRQSTYGEAGADRRQSSHRQSSHSEAPPASARAARQSVASRSASTTFRTRSSVSAREHFKRMASNGEKIDKQQERVETKDRDDKLSQEISKNFEGVAHLTEELDGLFAEMGRQTAVFRAGQKSRLRLIPTVGRTIEVKLPRRAEDVEELTIQIECRCDPHYHVNEQTNDDDIIVKGLVPEVDFDITIAESQRQSTDGPFKVQSLAQPEHRPHFTTEVQCLFVSFLSKEPCHLEFFCRVWQGPHGEHTRVEKVKRTDDDDEDKNSTGFGASVGMKLQVKLKARRQDLKDLEANAADTNRTSVIKPPEVVAATTVMSTTVGSGPIWMQKQQCRGRSFGDIIWDGGKPPREENAVIEAKRRLMNFFMGPCNKYFTRFKRAKGTWVKKLSPECPKKLLRWLRQAVENRGAMTFLAAAGAFQFFYQRQRELHLMRARMGIRQLVWYRAMFAASRMRYLMVIVSKGREDTKKRAKDRKELLARRGTFTAKAGDPGFESESGSDSDACAVEEVRKYVNMLKKAHGSPRSPQKAGRARSESPLSPSSTMQREISGMATSGDVKLTHGKSSAGLKEDLQAHKRRALVNEDQLLEWRLAKQGFVMRPSAAMRSDDRSGPRSRHMCLSPAAQPRNFVNELSQKLGRQLELHTPPPVEQAVHAERGNSGMHSEHSQDDHESWDQRVRAKALADVSGRVHIVKVRPDELALLNAKSPGRAEQIGSNHFKRFYKQSRQRAADTLVRREAKKEKPETGTGLVRVKISKRYLFQFFEPAPNDLPWVALMQGLMLIIQGKPQFQSPQEYAVFNTKLRSFNQIWKAALKKPGLFPPVEASLWSHPVLLHLAGKLQHAMCRGDGALAWKNSLFDGRFGESSDRDSTGASLHSGAQLGSESSHLLRKLAEVSGQFAMNANDLKASPPTSELTPYQATTASTTTTAKYPVRSFGERDNTNIVQQSIFRYEDKTLQLAHDLMPSDVRIELLRRKRQVRDALAGPREDHPLEAHSDLKAQQRYAQWMMRKDVPAVAKAIKSEMLPYFEGLAAPTAPTCSPPLASCKRKAQRAPAAETKGSPRRASEAARVDARSSWAVQVDAEIEDDKQLGRRASVAIGLIHEPASSRNGYISGPCVSPISSHEGSAVYTSEVPANHVSRKAEVVASSPQTAEEVGKLFLQMDALQTILAVDSSEIGGFANRCPAGWRSGYRAEPMSKDEIRRAHIVQKFCAGVQSKHGGNPAR